MVRPAIWSDPEWEAMKALRRPIGHHAAVQESAAITRTQWKLMGKMAAAKIDLYRIIATLNAKKIPFVLTGAHGIGGWTGRPRATKDIDILVKGGRNHARAVNALKSLYPHLEVRDLTGVASFFIPGERESVIDVTYPHRADIEETLKSRVRVQQQELSYRVPTLEAALANKYGAMLAINRNIQKRYQDGLDFGLMVAHSMDEGQKLIDLARLAELGEMVWPGGGGAEILRLVEEVKRTGVIDFAFLN
jgi:hypothetical protein